MLQSLPRSGSPVLTSPSAAESQGGTARMNMGLFGLGLAWEQGGGGARGGAISRAAGTNRHRIEAASPSTLSVVLDAAGGGQMRDWRERPMTSATIVSGLSSAALGRACFNPYVLHAIGVSEAASTSVSNWLASSMHSKQHTNSVRGRVKAPRLMGRASSLGFGGLRLLASLSRSPALHLADALLREVADEFGPALASSSSTFGRGESEASESGDSVAEMLRVYAYLAQRRGLLLCPLLQDPAVRFENRDA